MTEIWKPIEGYENLYHISNLGRVKSLPKQKGFIYKQETILKPKTTLLGYKTILLSKESKRKEIFIHRLVGKAFIANPNNYPVINHIDAVRNNNAVENLEWCTSSYNALHAFKLGNRDNHGEKHSHAKLTYKIVKKIRRLLETTRQSDLADKFKVSRATITLIKQNKVWTI
jgi:hypothetical protein